MLEVDVAGELAAGRAVADLSGYRKVAVSGTDAAGWLQDLVSADVDGLTPGRARHSLLLSPTGRIRARFTVVRMDSGWLLLQDPDQPKAIDGLLAPYVLSSQVTIRDRTGDLALFAFPGGDVPEGMVLPGDRSEPSCLGPGGVDVIVPVSDREAVAASLATRVLQAGEAAVEAWRVRAGIPRFGLDATEDDLPMEAGLDHDVAFDKGCYLGQEAVAKVRNLGHPRRLVVALQAGGPVSPGDDVRPADRPGDGSVGAVTSVAPTEDGWALFARIRWEARGDRLETAGGVPLRPRHASTPV